MMETSIEASPPDETAVREGRSAFNDAILRRDLSAINSILHDDYLVMPSYLQTCLDKPGILNVYESYFANPDFITFSRTPERILLSGDRQSAAEMGSWVGLWRSIGEKKVTRSGVYQAEWCLSEHGWKLMRESYVLLGG